MDGESEGKGGGEGKGKGWGNYRDSSDVRIPSVQCCIKGISRLWCGVFVCQGVTLGEARIDNAVFHSI